MHLLGLQSEPKHYGQNDQTNYFRRQRPANNPETDTWPEAVCEVVIVWRWPLHIKLIKTCTTATRPKTHTVKPDEM